MTVDKSTIGYTHSDKIEWPKLDISGRPFTKPADTAGVGGNRFVVVPYGFWNNPALIEKLTELRQHYAPPTSKRREADTVETEAQEGGE